jgi:molybdate transport system substrate-binding protein
MDLARPRGSDATKMVATRDADLAVIPVGEILHAAGVDFAGCLPLEIQFVQVFSAAVVAGSMEIENAKRLIEFFALVRAAEAIRKSGMEPPATST